MTGPNITVLCPRCQEKIPEEVSGIQPGDFNWTCRVCGAEYTIVVRFNVVTSTWGKEAKQ